MPLISADDPTRRWYLSCEHMDFVMLRGIHLENLPKSEVSLNTGEKNYICHSDVIYTYYIYAIFILRPMSPIS